MGLVMGFNRSKVERDLFSSFASLIRIPYVTIGRAKQKLGRLVQVLRRESFIRIFIDKAVEYGQTDFERTCY